MTWEIKTRLVVTMWLADPVNIWYVTLRNFSFRYICNTGNLCPSRYSNRVYVAERGTVACMCLEFRLVDRLL